MIIVFNCASFINENMSVVPLHLGISLITSLMGIDTILICISSLVDCLLIFFFPLWIFLTLLLIGKALYILKYSLMTQLMPIQKLFSHVFICPFIAFWKFFISCFNCFLWIPVCKAGSEWQRICLHFVVPAILRWSTSTDLFPLYIMFLVSSQRLWSEGIKDLGNQSTGNMTINRSTWHFSFQCGTVTN